MPPLRPPFPCSSTSHSREQALPILPQLQKQLWAEPPSVCGACAHHGGALPRTARTPKAAGSALVRTQARRRLDPQGLCRPCAGVGWRPGSGTSECPGAQVGTKLLHGHDLRASLDLKACGSEGWFSPSLPRASQLTRSTQGLPPSFNCQPDATASHTPGYPGGTVRADLRGPLLATQQHKASGHCGRGGGLEGRLSGRPG